MSSLDDDDDDGFPQEEEYHYEEEEEEEEAENDGGDGLEKSMELVRQTPPTTASSAPMLISPRAPQLASGGVGGSSISAGNRNNNDNIRAGAASSLPSSASSATVKGLKPVMASSVGDTSGLNMSVGSVASASSIASSRKHAGADYYTVSAAQVQADQDYLTREVSELLAIPEDHASVLLLDYRWNKEKLVDAFYADPDACRVRAGAIQGVVRYGAGAAAGGISSVDRNNNNNTNAAGSATNTRQTSKKNKPTMFWCNVIYDHVPMEETLSMGCENEG